MSMLRELRKSKGCTLREISAFVGVSESYLSQVERGNRLPSIELSEKLSNVYECELDLILIATEQPPRWFVERAARNPMNALLAAKDIFEKYAE